MIFQQLNPGSCRAYLVGNEASGEVMIIDPRLEFVPDYLRLLEKNHWRLTRIFDTHTHADHVSGAHLLKNETGAEYLMYQLSKVTPVSERIADGAVFDMGGIKVTALYTPGHSKDSLSLILPGKVLTGDALFLDDGGAGRDDLYGGDPGEHFESLQRLGSLPGDTIVYPGHEYRGFLPSSLDQQKKSNPYLHYQTKTSFIDFAKSRVYGPADWMAEVVKANLVGSTKPVAAPEADINTCESINICEAVDVTGDTLASVSSVKMITPAELMGEQGEFPLLLDVRGAEELSGDLGSLPGIIHIPLTELMTRMPEISSDKTRQIVTICKTGNRARSAAMLLLANGFTSVRILAGGMKAYREAGGQEKP